MVDVNKLTVGVVVEHINKVLSTCNPNGETFISPQQDVKLT
jgi:hypothetical protein